MVYQTSTLAPNTYSDKGLRGWLKSLVLGLCHVLYRKLGPLLVGFHCVPMSYEKELTASMSRSFYSVTCFLCKIQFSNPKENSHVMHVIKKVHVVGRPLKANMIKLNRGASHALRSPSVRYLILPAASMGLGSLLLGPFLYNGSFNSLVCWINSYVLSE